MDSNIFHYESQDCFLFFDCMEMKRFLEWNIVYRKLVSEDYE